MNVTPDSFSDGGRFFDPKSAIQHGLRLLQEGADVLDIGGESTRPAGTDYGTGAERVEPDEEIRRVLPVVRGLVQAGAVVSLDTVKPAVADACLDAGARILNDVSGAPSDGLLAAAARHDAELVIMHSRGGGEVSAPNTTYQNLVSDVRAELMVNVARAKSAGVSRVWIDPGIGFAKTAAQSAELLRQTGALVETGCPVLVGPSRKSFIGRLCPDPDGSMPPPQARIGGTAASVVFAVLAGVKAIRVHDVRAMRQTVRLTEVLRP